MDGDQDNDGPPVAAAAEGGGRVSLELKMYRASREGWPDLLQQLINEKRAGITPEACTVFEDEEHDEDYYDELDEIYGLPGWTCLHIAAFNGNTECVKILIREGIDGISTRAEDESTPLMAACAGLPYTEDCIKLLIEYSQDLNLTNEQELTALQIAIAWKPTLEIVQLLIDKGANLDLETNWSQELMMLLFGCRDRILQCPDDGEDESLEPDEQAKIAKVAIYLAN